MGCILLHCSLGIMVTPSRTPQESFSPSYVFVADFRLTVKTQLCTHLLQEAPLTTLPCILYPAAALICSHVSLLR